MKGFICTHLLLSFRSNLLARTILNLGRVVPSSRSHTTCLSHTQNLQKFLPLCDHWACGCPASSKPNPAAAVSPHGGGRVLCPHSTELSLGRSLWRKLFYGGKYVLSHSLALSNQAPTVVITWYLCQNKACFMTWKLLEQFSEVNL